MSALPQQSVSGSCGQELSASLDTGTWKLTPETYRRLMRMHGRTIRSIATDVVTTQKRVRSLRNHGITGSAISVDEAIWTATGKWPSREERAELTVRLR